MKKEFMAACLAIIATGAVLSFLRSGKAGIEAQKAGNFIGRGYGGFI